VRTKSLRKGILIAIEGIDGAGKTTQSIMLFEKLRSAGYPVVCLHEPTDGKWGNKIKDLAKNGRQKITAEDELNLFYQDRLEAALKRIREKRNDTPNHFERNKYLEKVRQLFLKLFRNRTYAKIIKADDFLSEQEIASDVWHAVEPVVREAEET
jgi:thymidylate kinase